MFNGNLDKLVFLIDFKIYVKCKNVYFVVYNV